MYDVIMYDGGIYRSDELYELIEDVGGVVLVKNRSSQMLTVTMSVPHEDRAAVEALKGYRWAGQVRAACRHGDRGGRTHLGPSSHAASDL